MNINKDWHLAHKMPQNPNLEQRVKWHLDHVKHCTCRALDGGMLEEFKKRFMGTHREFWIYFNKDDHKALAVWAVECAMHVLPYFEEKYPHDSRPRKAIQTLQEWIDTDKFNMSVIRGASLGAHAAACEVKTEDDAARFAARACGQAVATAHVPTHALGPTIYGVKAAIAANKQKDKAGSEERDWQIQHLPKNLHDWVIKWLSIKETRI